jgi:hypothetical protein
MQEIYRAKEKKMAYVLHREFHYTKAAIATLMKISPQQMGVWIKEVDYEFRIHQLNGELEQIKNEFLRLGYSPQKVLDSSDFSDLSQSS